MKLVVPPPITIMVVRLLGGVISRIVIHFESNEEVPAVQEATKGRRIHDIGKFLVSFQLLYSGVQGASAILRRGII